MFIDSIGSDKRINFLHRIVPVETHPAYLPRFGSGLQRPGDHPIEQMRSYHRVKQSIERLLQDTALSGYTCCFINQCSGCFWDQKMQTRVRTRSNFPTGSRSWGAENHSGLGTRSGRNWIRKDACRGGFARSK